MCPAWAVGFGRIGLDTHIYVTLRSIESSVRTVPSTAPCPSGMGSYHSQEPRDVGFQGANCLWRMATSNLGSEFGKPATDLRPVATAGAVRPTEIQSDALSSWTSSPHLPSDALLPAVIGIVLLSVSEHDGSFLRAARLKWRLQHSCPRSGPFFISGVSAVLMEDPHSTTARPAGRVHPWALSCSPRRCRV